MRSTVVLLFLLAWAGPVVAQQPATGRLEGTVNDAARTRTVKGTSIVAVRLDPAPAISLSAAPDDRGRFRLDSLPAGRYMVQAENEFLDSLGLAMPALEVLVAPGRTARANVDFPSAVVLRDAVCPGLALKKGHGAVAGRAIDADSERPIPGADVAVSWHEVSVDSTTARSSRRERGGSVKTGPRGEYRICGVPTGTWLLLQLQHAGRAANVVRVSVKDDEGVVARTLSLSVIAAPSLATFDSVRAVVPVAAAGQTSTDTSRGLGLTGSAMVTGIVRGIGGRPLPGAEVRVLNSASVGRTGPDGRYALSGLPAGTQVLEIRRIGFLIGESAVELRSGRSVNRDVQLKRIVPLDSVRVLAQRARYPEFEYNRRHSFFGHFLTGDQILQKKPLNLSDVVVSIGGYRLQPDGPYMGLVSNVAKLKSPNCGLVNVVIDGIEWADINELPPSQIAAMESYKDGLGAPPPYRADCGLIVIWSKRYRPMPRP